MVALFVSLFLASNAEAGVLLDRTGTLETGDTVLSDNTLGDEHTVSVTAGQRLRVAVRPGSDPIDPYVVVMLPDGTSFANDDYRSGDSDSRVDNLVVGQSGIMTVLVSTYAYNQDPSFRSSQEHMNLERGDYRVWVATMDTPFISAANRDVPTGGDAVEQNEVPTPAPGTTSCSNTCAYAGDGECDDGGPNSLYAVCTYGTDCTDCGPR